MADERYVIDIILNARDDVSRAVTQAAASLGALDTAADRSEQRSQKLGDTLDRNRERFRSFAEQIDRNAEKLKDHATKVDLFSQTMRRNDEQLKRSREEWERQRESTEKAATELKKSETRVQTLTASLNKLTDAQAKCQKEGRRWNEYERDIAKVRDQLEGANKAQDKWADAMESGTKALREHGQELERTNRRREEGVKMIERNESALEKETKQYERNIQALVKARQEMSKASARGVDPMGFRELSKDADKAQRDVKQSIAAMKAAARDQVKMKFGVDVDNRSVLEMQAIREAAGRDITVNMDMDAAAFQAKALAVKAVKADLGRDVKIKVDTDIGPITTAMTALRKQLDESRHSVAAFDNQIRGLLAFGAVGLFQPLMTGAIGLAGALVQVASSAAMAGAAIGISLTSGIAQALPMMGLMIAAATRIGAVVEAVQQFDLMRKQASAARAQDSGDDTGQINALKNANDALAAAQQGVVDAQGRLHDSQVELTKARFEARRELQDLILAEREAELAARGAALSQAEAQKTLQQTILGGDISGLARAQLGVDEAAAGRRRANLEAQRASRDLSLQRSGSPLRPDTQVEDAQEGIEEAKRNIQDAQKSVEQARRGIESAKASAATAANDMTAAGANLQFFLSQLTDAERELYRAFLDIRKQFNAVIRPMTDNLIESLTYGVKRTTQILNDPSFIESATKLSEAMSSQLDRVTKEFTSPKWVKFWEEMMGEAGKNLKPITAQFLQLSNIFRRIADAGQPLFRLMVKLIGDAVDDFDKFVGRGKQLDDFMADAAKHMQAWFGLARALTRLFIELLDSGAKGGLDLIKDLTKEINKAANWIDGHSKKMDQFWKGVRTIMDEVGKTLIALAEEVVSTFDPGSVRALGQVLRRVLIPALGEAFRAMGQLFQIIEGITKFGPAAEFAKWAVAITIFMKVANTFGHMLQGLVFAGVKVLGWVEKFGALLTRFSPALAQMAANAGGLGRALLIGLGPMVAIGGAIVFLMDKFGVLDDVIRAFKDIFIDIFDAVREPMEGIIENVKEIADAFGLMGGDAEGLGKILKFIFVTIIMNGFIPALKGLGKIFENVFGGVFQIIEGVLDLLTGDFKGGLSNIFGGLFRLMTAPFRGFWEFVKGVFGGVAKWFDDHVIDPIGNAFGKIGGVVEDAFMLAAQAVESAINTIIDIINFFITKIGLDEIKPVNLVGDDEARAGNRRAGRNAARGGGFAEFRAGGGRVGYADGGPVLHPTNTAGFVGKAAGNVAGTVSDIVQWISDSGRDLAKTGWGFGNIYGQIGRDAIDWVMDKGKDVAGDGLKAALGPFGVGLSALGLKTGGHVEGPGGVDTIPAMLTRGEFVVTPNGEQILESITGVPGILGWLAGKQARAQGFATGGRVGFASGGRATSRRGAADAPAVDTGPLFEQIMAALNAFGGEATGEWNKIWNTITNVLDKSIDEMVKMADKGFGKIRKESIEAMKKMASGVRQQMNEVERVISRGMNDIVDMTNKGLKAFGVDQISLSASPEKSKKKAVGGWIGNRGERGGDVVPAWLGRGEAVLNWAHQRMVEPALRATYGFGLDGLFGRTDSRHGAESPGGFATGGQAGGMVRIPGDPNMTGGRDTVNASVVDLASWLVRTFNLEVGYAYDPGGGHVSPGHNVTGTALDVVPGPGGSWDDVNRAVAWATQHGMTVYYDGRFGSTALENHGEGNHAHFELQSNVEAGGRVFGEKMDVKRMIVEGTDGALKEMAQGALDIIRDAAQKFADEQGFKGDGAEAIEDLPASLNALNHVFQEGQTILGENVVAAIAEWAGLPGVTFAQIAHGESGFDPGIRGEDPGGTFGYGLWQITSGYNDDIINKYGGPNQMYNPIINARAAKDIYDRAGIGAWYGTQYMTSPNAHYNGPMPTGPGPGKKMAAGGYVNSDDVGEEFATGGVVGSRSLAGSAIPIVAHAGEWVLNTSQQLRLAGAMGSTLSGIQDLLGFGGAGKMSYAEGGEVENWLPKFFEKFAEHFGRAFRRMFGEDPTFANKLYGAFAPVLGDLFLGIRQFVEGIASLGKVSKDFEQDVKRLADQQDRRPRGDATQASSATQRVVALERGVARVIQQGSQLFRASGDKLDEVITKFFDGIAGEGGLLDQMTEAFESFQIIMQTKLNEAIVKINSRGRVIGRRLQPGQIIDRELQNLERGLRILLGQRGDIVAAIKEARKALEIARKYTDAEAIKQAQKELDKARKKGNEEDIKAAKKALEEAKKKGNDAAEEAARTALQALLDRQQELDATIAETRLSILDKMEEKMSAELDKINQRAEDALSGYDSGRNKRGQKKRPEKFGADVRRQIAEAMGFIDQIPALAERNIEILTKQQDDLKKLLRKAYKRGNLELARDLENQIADLQTQIVSATVDMITFAAEEVNRQAERRNAGIDFWSRVLDVQAGIGNELGAEQARGNVIMAQRSSLQTQIAGLQGVIASAISQGMGEGVIGPLQDALLDLQAQLYETTLALYENHAAIIAAKQTIQDRAFDMRNAMLGLANTMADVREGFGDTVGAAQQRTGLIQGERGSLQQRVTEVQNLLNEALYRGLKEEITTPLRLELIDLQSQLEQNRLALYQNTIAILDAQRQEVEEDRANRASFLDLQNVLADVRQGFGDVFGAEQARASNLLQQRGLLSQQLYQYQNLLASALSQGLHDDVVDPLQQQINTLMGELEQNRLAIYQNTIAQLQAVQAQYERGVSAAESLQNLAQRFADVRGGFGDTVGAAQASGSILEQRRDLLNDRLSTYQNLLAQAIAQNMHYEVTDPLQETINDLLGSIEENSLAIYENTIATRDASIALIQDRQGFTGGVVDSLGQLLDVLGQISGNPNISKMIVLLQTGIAQLTATGEALRAQMSEFVSSNLGSIPGSAAAILNTLAGLHGEDFVNAIMGLNLNEIVDQLGGPASPLAMQFQMLIQAIIDNETALWQNTEELQNLQDDRQIQQFTSTAWQWFRQAIFTGMGGLLPQYSAGTPYYDQNAPAMAEGGDVSDEGLHYLHRGEFVVPERFAAAARALVNAGSLAGMMSAGSVMDLYGPTGMSGTMGTGFAQSAGVNSATELRQLREAMLKSRQHIETHIHGRESGDDEFLSRSIAFRAKIPTS